MQLILSMGAVDVSTYRSRNGRVVDLNFHAGEQLVCSVGLTKDDCVFGSRMSQAERGVLAVQTERIADRFELEWDKTVIREYAADLLKMAEKAHEA